MKIAYITIHIESKIINGGVGNKINSQISIWRSMGHSVELFSLTPELITSIPGARQFFFKPSVTLRGFKFVTREISRSRSLARLISAVSAYEPDVIYLRYGLFAFPLHSVFKIAPVILEVNSNDVEEYRSKGPFFYWLNRAGRRYLFSRSAGLVMTSYEIQDLPANRRYHQPQCVIANGINLDSLHPLPAPKNQNPVIVFVGTPDSPWHGVDKLYDLAMACPDVRIEVVGYQPQDSRSVPVNMRFHGYLARNQYMEIFAQADIALGSLALHRNNMQEASPLKVREALAYGVPLVLPFVDTDLRDVQADFLLRLSNNEDNIRMNVDRIREFAYRMRGVRVDREIVRPFINQRQKEEKRLTFLAKVLEH